MTYVIKPNNLYTDEILCSHCHAKNPIRAYICLTCFKLLHPPIKVPIWKQAFQGTRPVFLMVVLFSLLAVISFYRWTTRVEELLVSIQEQNQEYQESMAFFMKTRTDFQKAKAQTEPETP